MNGIPNPSSESRKNSRSAPVPWEGSECRQTSYRIADSGITRGEPGDAQDPNVSCAQRPAEFLRPEVKYWSDPDAALNHPVRHNVELEVPPGTQAPSGGMSDRPGGAIAKTDERSGSDQIPSLHDIGVTRDAPTDRPETVEQDINDVLSESARPATDSAVAVAAPPAGLPPVLGDGISDVIDLVACCEQQERDEARGVIAPVDWLTGQLIDIGKGGLESSLWKVGEEIADRLHPLGPTIVRGFYMAKQVVEIFKGHRSADGFYVKASVPGLDLPLGLEIVVRMRPDLLNRNASGFGFNAEIQVFEPFFPDLDVKHRLPDTAGILGQGVPPTYTPPPRRDDPWLPSLVLIGDGLILDLAQTLADATSTPLSVMTKRLPALRPGRLRVRLRGS